MKTSFLAVAAALLCTASAAIAADPLPSWNDTAAKQAIVQFVERIAKEGSPDFVPPAQRIAAFGNSDGDLQMLQWTEAGSGARFCLFVHHTDAEREFAYDRDSHIGRLDKGLDEAAVKGWTVVDMKHDWKTVFPAKRQPVKATP